MSRGPGVASVREPAKRTRAVRAVRLLAWVLLAIVGSAALVLLIAFALLRTSRVQQKLTAGLSTRAQAALAGRLSIGALHLRGPLELCAQDLELADPDGVPALRVESLCISIDVPALLHKEIHLLRVALEKPQLFLTREVGAAGEKTSSLQRALAPRSAAPAAAAPNAIFAYAIIVDALAIHAGSFELRAQPGAAPTFTLHALEVGPAHARYSATGAAAQLALTLELGLARESKVKLSVAAQLDGTLAGGRILLRALDLQLGDSRAAAEGSLDLATLAGALRLHDLLVTPADLDALLGPSVNPIGAELRGEADLNSDGRDVRATLHLTAGREGLIDLAVRSTIEVVPRWSLQLTSAHVDPSRFVRGGPAGLVSFALELQGRGIPHLTGDDPHGDLSGAVAVGPAQLAAAGPLAGKARFVLRGNTLQIENLEADALALRVRASGKLGLHALALDLQLDASDLARFSRSLAALQHKPSLGLSGTAHLSAHVEGEKESLAAKLHLRSPAMALGAGFRVETLALDGALHGPIARPRGAFTIAATRVVLGGIAIDSPQIAAGVEWPRAHLVVDGTVNVGRAEDTAASGAVHLSGAAQIDEDNRGALLRDVSVSWPGTAFAQTAPARILFRERDTVLDSFVLAGERGRISLAGQVQAAGGAGAHAKAARIEARLEFEKLQLAGLPGFALPPALHLGGAVDAQLEFAGLLSAPDLSAKVSLHDVDVQTAHGLNGDASVQLDGNRLRAQATLTGIAQATLSLRANLPRRLDARMDSPIEFDVALAPFDLAQLAPLLERPELVVAHPQGTASLHVVGQGTLGAPRVKLELSARQLSLGALQKLDLDLHLSCAEALQLELDAMPGGDARVQLKVAAKVAARELVALARAGGSRAALEPLLARALSLRLDVEKILLGTLSADGRAPLVRGELDGTIDGSGTADAPLLHGAFTLRALQAGSHALGDLSLVLDADRTGARANASLERSAATVLEAGSFVAKATLRAPISARSLLDRGASEILSGTLEGSATLHALDLTILSSLAPMLRRTSGTLDGALLVHGPLANPIPQGELHLRRGSVDIVGQGIWDDLAFDATFTPQRRTLEQLSGSIAGGTFSGNASLERPAGESGANALYRFAGELHAGDAESVRGRRVADATQLAAHPIPIRQAGEVRAEFEGALEFAGTQSAGSTIVSLKLRDSSVHVTALPDRTLPSLPPNPDILLSTPGETPHLAGIDLVEMQRQQLATAQSNLRIDANLTVEKLQVSATDFDFPLTSQMHAAWDSRHPDQTHADGTIEISAGMFTALGRRFAIEHATITESGDDPANPELDIRARYANAQASVLVVVSGSVQAPQIELSSTPPLDQNAIAFFLATGRVQETATQVGSSVDLGNAATSVVGALLFGQLREGMANIIPIDVVNIEAAGGDRPPEASVGKYIGDRIFVGYRQRFSPGPTENETEGTIEYQIVRGVGAAATVGEKNQGLMVTYTMEF